MNEYVFKIMRERDGRLLIEIPLRVILPHQDQALINHGGQSFGNLNARGGLTAKEALHVLYNIRWYDSLTSARIIRLTQDEALQELVRVVKERYVKMVDEEQRAKDAVPCNHSGDRPTDISHGMKKCKKCGAFLAA